MREDILKLTCSERMTVEVSLELQLDRMKDFVRVFKDDERMEQCVQKTTNDINILEGVLQKLYDLREAK